MWSTFALVEGSVWIYSKVVVKKIALNYINIYRLEKSSTVCVYFFLSDLKIIFFFIFSECLFWDKTQFQPHNQFFKFKMYFVQSALRLKKLEFYAGYEVDSMNIIETQSIEIDLVERQKK